jgi:glucose dehydrogenase
MLGEPAPAVASGVVLAGFGSGEVAALGTLDGALVWSDTLGSTVGASPLEFSSIHAEPIIDGGTAYTISVGGLMTATDMRTGRRVWERTIAGGQTPTLAGNWIFLITQDDTVTCLDKATGHVRWNSVLPRFHKPNSGKQPIIWTGPLLAGGHLVMTSSYGQLLLMSPADGTIEDQRKLRGPASEIPIAADGKLLVLTDDGRLTAIR